uniref:Uncharacterized protein n=1 Tax=Rhizophora mucronata TaxID=61149 RepID=A0A2P2QU00_RHIMU
MQGNNLQGEIIKSSLIITLQYEAFNLDYSLKFMVCAEQKP